MLLAALFLRPMRRKPLRFAVTALGVAAGVAAVVATVAAGRAAIASLESGVLELSGRARLEVLAPGGLPDEVLGMLRPVSGAALLVPVVDEVALVETSRAPVRLLGVDALVDAGARDLGPELGEAARAAPKLGADERFLEFVGGAGAWLGADLARELGLARGGTLALDVRARRADLPVLGVIDAARGAAFARVVLVDVARAQELVGEPGRLDRVEVVPRATTGDRDADERALDALAARIAELLPRGATVSRPAQRGAEARGLVRSLEFNLTALSGISLLVGVVLVATTLATSVVQRARTIALVRSLGASPAQIRGAILVEAGCIGALGGAIGTFAGWAGARALLPQMRASMATVVSAGQSGDIRLDASLAATGIGLGVLAALAAAWLPVLEGARTPPIQGLRAEAPRRLSARERRIALFVAACFALLAGELVQLPAWRGLPVAALAASIACLGVVFAVLGPAVDGLASLAVVRRAFALPIPLRLACAALAAGRRRAAWAAGAVGVAVTLSVSIGAMVHSFRETVVDWTDRSLRADFTIRPVASREGLPVGRLDPAVVDAAAQVVGRDALVPLHEREALFRGEKFVVEGASLGNLAGRGGPVLVDGEDPSDAIARAHEKRGALVSESFARRFGVARDDEIRFEVAGFPVERRVEGVFRDYGDSRGTATLGLDDFLAYFPDDAPLQVGVHLAADADRDAVRAALESALAARFQLEILPNAEVRARVLSVFDRTFAITSALQAVAGLVAVIAVLSVLYALVAERRGDLALLAAIGADRAQLAGVVVGQAALLGLLGAATGAIAGLAVGLVLVVVVNVQSFGWTIDFHQPWRLLWTTVAGVVAACAIAGLLPARATDPRRLAGALREEAA